MTIRTNLDRADEGRAITQLMQVMTGVDLEDALSDALCQLMHFANATDNNDFEEALDRARMNFKAEIDEEGMEGMST